MLVFPYGFLLNNQFFAFLRTVFQRDFYIIISGGQRTDADARAISNRHFTIFPVES